MVHKIYVIFCRHASLIALGRVDIHSRLLARSDISFSVHISEEDGEGVGDPDQSSVISGVKNAG